ncbi:cytochrome P450 [Mycena olivaceomarginata]|nr:cytochrome P450 [Mycena olivaceomarginata]
MALYPELSTRSVLGSLIVLGIILFARSNKHKEKLPPGPGGLPILGNLLQIPKDRAWLAFSECRKTYGDIIYLNIAGQNAVASDLLDRRAGIYSDRARNIHNDVWKRMRRGSHEALNNQVAKNYFGFQETESTLLIDQFLKDPNDWDNHLRRVHVPHSLYSKNPDILRVNRFTERALHAAAPGAFLVEYFTWMEHLPRFMSPWRRYAEDWFRADSVLFKKLFSNVKDRVDGGDETSSVASTLIHDQEKLNLTSHESAWVAATLYAAGAETTSGQMAWFMMAMILYPEAKKKAQEELDTVVGRNRMPVFQDYEHLPYICALVKEIMHWRGVAPLSVPHRLAQDDYYEGHFLPKDTICIVNVWALNHDPEVYGPDAEDFVPERHLNASGRLNHHTYGFGRRICVGRHISNNSMFIKIACLLWSFNIAPGKDKDGNIVLPDPTDSIDEGLVVRPAVFPCSITPQNAEVELVISQTKELHGYE